jgi:hypothetical protein
MNHALHHIFEEGPLQRATPCMDISKKDRSRESRLAPYIFREGPLQRATPCSDIFEGPF